MARLLVFAKAPVPGSVKSRLVPAIDAADAAQLHMRMVRRALATACAVAPGSVELHCSPTTDHVFFRDCAKEYGASLHVQCAGDIGARMSDALRDASRSCPLVLIGTDCPARTADDLRVSLDWLAKGVDAVLGPVEDGGYSLIGLAAFDERLFQCVQWSSEHVMAQTRERLSRCGFSARELPTRWDVDRPADLVRLRHSAPDLVEGIAIDERPIPAAAL